MNTDFIREQILHMTPSSLSAREQHLYRAEKMVMRQFLLMKQYYKVPFYLSVRDMKKWLLGRRRFLEEFEETAKVAEERKLLVAELAWTSARRLCLDQMERELHEELQREKHLCILFRRKVTLEGLQIFLSTFQPKAEQHVRIYLDYLSNQLLNISCAHHGSSSLSLRLKLQRAFAPFGVKLVEAALEFLLCEAEELVEVAVLSRYSSLASALGSRAEDVSAHIGEQLAEAASSCFSPNTPVWEAVVKNICTSEALDVVRDLQHRFDQRSKTFHLLDFDESFFSAREAATFAAKDMEDKVKRDAYLQALWEQNATPMRCAVWRMKRAIMKRRIQRGRQIR